MGDFKVRPMERLELDLVISWAAAEGWNPGAHDAECFYLADQSGFFVGEINNEIVASISAIAYSKDFGFIGFYIVKPDYRGQGFGLQLWNAAMTYLGTQRTIGLDGVVAQQENYMKSGFQIAYRHIRYETLGGGIAPDGVEDLKTFPFEKIVAYDRDLFPSERKNFLQHWINQPKSAALGVLKNGLLVGYGVIRPSHTGYRIGPLNADDEQIAEQLLLAMLAFCPGAPVFLDVPDINPGAMKMAQRFGMNPVFEAARMYTKAIPNLAVNRVYAVTTLEVG